MCGRYTLRTTPAKLKQLFKLLSESTLFPPRYNIAPSQPIVAIRIRDGKREASVCKWGLVPRWAKDPSVGNQMINARAETIATKPAYRDAFKNRRCLIPADGFYEWQAQGKAKHPFFIHRPGGEPFAFAGLWESWGAETKLETAAIITTTPNTVTKPIHDRMPAIIDEKDFEKWLDPATPPEELAALLKPISDDVLTAHPVSRLVNAPANDRPECVEPDRLRAEEPTGLFGNTDLPKF